MKVSRPTATCVWRQVKCSRLAPKGGTKEMQLQTLQRESYAAIAAQNDPCPEHPVTTETPEIQMTVTDDNSEHVPLGMTHTGTESDDIMMGECNDPSPYVTQNTTNTTEKQNEET